jgi:hypothetical protein
MTLISSDGDDWDRSPSDRTDTDPSSVVTHDQVMAALFPAFIGRSCGRVDGDLP